MKNKLPFVSPDVFAVDAMEALRMRGAKGVAAQVGGGYRLFDAHSIASAIAGNPRIRILDVASQHLDLAHGALLPELLGNKPPLKGLKNYSLEVSVPIWVCPKQDCDQWSLQPRDCPDHHVAMEKD
jgi:hypothetical protein